MPRRSFERIALTRLLVGGCAVFGACALVQQAQAEHNGGGGGVPVHTPPGRPYAMPHPRYKPHLHPSHLLRLHPSRDIALRRH
jgi:hypothetical protein